nr:hypothetical protein [Tanacetum cinerariifolium]
MVEMGGNEEIFTFEPWRRAFDSNEPIYTEFCHDFYSTYDFDEEAPAEFVTRLAKKMQLFTDEVLNGPSASIYYRSFDATTLRELIGLNRMLIAKDPALSRKRKCDKDIRIHVRRLSLNFMIESEGNWDGPEYLDTANSGKKKEGLDDYDHITDLEYEKNLITNEFAVKLGLQYEVKKNDEMVGEELIRGYKAIMEKGVPEVFVLPARLEGKYNYCALVDTGSNISIMPYHIYELLKRDQVKPRSDEVRMLDYSSAKTMGRLINVLCQVGVTTILANFMLLDVPVDRDVPIMFGRSFLYTCGEIMNTIKGKMLTFDGFAHQEFDVVKMRDIHAKSDSDDDEDYYLKIDELGKSFYRPNHGKYLNYDDLMDIVIAFQDAINPF